MQKSKTYDIATTNIANLGSDLEKKVREAAAQKEPAWLNAGKSEGLQIWRIEKFNVVSWPIDRYGEFYSGDSYIVLNTYKKSPDSPALAWDVHFWLGLETTQDEAGTAAYKTVELDDMLHGGPVQHREVQGHETRLFLSYFKHFIVLQGGIDSGFRHVNQIEVYPVRLLHIKSVNKNMVVRQVADASYRSLNSGDVFILDTKDVIFQWNGDSSSPLERQKASEVSRSIVDQRKGAPKLVVIDGCSDDDPNFWKAIGGKGPVKSASEAGDEPISSPKKLLRLSDSSGALAFIEVKTGTASRNDFKSEDVFVYDAGYQVFVWIGSGATANERRGGLKYAQQYLTQHERPIYLPISRVFEGNEGPSFEQAVQTH